MQTTVAVRWDMCTVWHPFLGAYTNNMKCMFTSGSDKIVDSSEFK